MKFGVISTANIGTNVVIPAIRHAGHEIVGIASRDDRRAAETTERLDIPHSFGSYEQLLESNIDAVYNPLPNALHAEWTKRAADHGLHVLCEKPLAVDAEQAREMGNYCDEQGVTLMEAFMYRYHPRTERAIEIANDLDIRSMKATFQFPMRNPDDVRLNPDLAGGSLMDVGCYAVSAVRLFLADPERVYATTADTIDSGVDTELTAILEYENGVTAEISSGFTTTDTQTYRVEAENGWLEAPNAFVPRGDDGIRLEYRIDNRTVTERFDPTNQYALEVEHFVDCVETGTHPETDANEAVRTMAIIDALYESAREGEPVSV